MEFSSFFFNNIQLPPKIHHFINSELLVQESDIHKRKPLSKAEISQRLQKLSNWDIKDNQLSYTHKFKNFVEAINFINCLVTPAETVNHHPELAISYNKVTITLKTHDVSALTALDFELATTISQLINTWKSDQQCRF